MNQYNRNSGPHDSGHSHDADDLLNVPDNMFTDDNDDDELNSLFGDDPIIPESTIPSIPSSDSSVSNAEPASQYVDPIVSNDHVDSDESENPSPIDYDQDDVLAPADDFDDADEQALVDHPISDADYTMPSLDTMTPSDEDEPELPPLNMDDMGIPSMDDDDEDEADTDDDQEDDDDDNDMISYDDPDNAVLTPQWPDNTDEWEKDTEDNWGVPDVEKLPPDHDSDLYKQMSAGLDDPSQSPLQDTDGGEPEPEDAPHDADSEELVDDDNNEPAPSEQSDDESQESTDKPSFKDKFRKFMDGVKSEIGDPNADDDGHGQDLVPSNEAPHNHHGDIANKTAGTLAKTPLRAGKALLSGASRTIRLVLSLSSILVVLVLAWLAFNLPAALNHTKSNDTENDEGSVKVSMVSYDASTQKSSITMKNDSELIGHVSGYVGLYAYTPSLSHLTSILVPQKTGSCNIPSTDINPGKDVTLTLDCQGGDSGFWIRPRAVIQYE
jgi:hypothetical protein